LVPRHVRVALQSTARSSRNRVEKRSGAATAEPTGVTVSDSGYTPKSVTVAVALRPRRAPGPGAFSARLRNATTGLASLWSPEFSITVQRR